MDKITKTDVEAAYKAGFEAGRKNGVQIGIEMGLNHTIEVLSGELHRYKFPEGHEKRWNYKIDQHRPDDNSTFEFTYETYEERMKKKTAEMREMREREADERRSRRNRWKKNVPSMKKLWKYAPKEAK
mgnify:CR=1 FL=1|tara:strand:+ start:563 stop:946 length:384 start_codon:yes stop_codon:yes gene_type:complete